MKKEKKMVEKILSKKITNGLKYRRTEDQDKVNSLYLFYFNMDDPIHYF